VEKLERFVVAWDFTQAAEKVNSSEGDRQAIVDQMHDYEETERALLGEVSLCSKKIEEIIATRDSETEGILQKLKLVENDLSKELVKQNTLLSNQKDLMQAEHTNRHNLKKQIDSAENLLADKQVKLTSVERELVQKEAVAQQAEQEAILSRERYQNAVAGVVDEQTSTDILSIPEQVATWEKRARESHSQLQTNNLTAQHMQTSIAQLRQNQISQRQGYELSQQSVTASRDKLRALEGRHNTLSGNMSSETTLRNQVNVLRSNTQVIRDGVEKLSAQLEARLSFDFANPCKGFDRSKVKGLVAKLIAVPNRVHATALEVVAGAKLFQVVVDNENTGKLLLQHGQLKKRVTILPLNKIDSRTLSAAVVNRAKEIARAHHSTVNLAIELVTYDESVSAAIGHVFGQTLICENAEAAQAIAFDKQVRTKCVTYDGDVYDPSGTLTGVRNNGWNCAFSQLTSFVDYRVLKMISASYLQSLKS
jgi:structural maintenance of chromosome 2